MELTSVNSAKSTWLFDLADLTPRSTAIFPRLLEWIKSRYGFAQAPASPMDVDAQSKGWIFKMGTFQVPDGAPVLVELGIYTDGLSANTWASTRTSDAFLEDALSTAAKELSIQYKPSMIRKKWPLSELNVRLDAPMTRVNPQLAQIAEKINALSPEKSAFELGGISFWTDTSEAALKLSQFAIERKAGAPFSENRFFSRASLHTEDHLSVLQDFEKLLLG